MKNIFVASGIAALTILSSISCSKQKVEQKIEDLVIQLMTNGTWIVTKFTEGTTETTSLFTGWECQFHKNLTCEAIKGTTRVSGTWSASAPAQTISGQFPAGSPAPLEKINGTWKIVKSNYTKAEFSQTKSGVDYKMELTKK